MTTAKAKRQNLVDVPEGTTEAPMAAHQPAKKKATLPKKEFHIDDVAKLRDRSTLIPGFGDDLGGAHDPVIVEPAEVTRLSDKQAKEKWLADLAFAEEPVTIRIEEGGRPFSTLFEEARVNNECTILLNGRWMPCKGFSIGRTITIKRKFVEVLARCITEKVTTRRETIHRDDDETMIQNYADRKQKREIPFVILRDKSPRAQEWREQILGYQFF